jgi:hypothetical protein
VTNSYYKISLDIHDHGSNVSLKAKKGDTGRLLYITLMDGRNPYVITNDCYAVFAGKKADGNVLYNRCSITGNTIIYEFTPQTTSAVGKADCEIKLYGAENKLLTSARFTLIVDDTVYNEGDEIEPMSEVSALTALVSEANTLVRDIESKLANGEFVGPQGISGVVAPTIGYFALEVDSATGNIYCVTEDAYPIGEDGESTAPQFTMDENGNLYYEIREG